MLGARLEGARGGRTAVDEVGVLGHVVHDPEAVRFELLHPFRLDRAGELHELQPVAGEIRREGARRRFLRGAAGVDGAGVQVNGLRRGPNGATEHEKTQASNAGKQLHGGTPVLW